MRGTVRGRNGWDIESKNDDREGEDNEEEVVDAREEVGICKREGKGAKRRW